ncbi:MAG: TolC family protein [Akkermansiaceae bacterium]
MSGQVSRSQATRYALTYNPTLQAQRAELRAMEAEVVQAGLSPNPELEVEAENFGGSGGRRGFNSAEITAAISQKLELGGKRKKRTLVAALAAKALHAEIQSEEREIETKVDDVFTSILEAKQLRVISEQNVARANEQLQAVTTLMEVGTSTRIDVNKAKLAVSEAKELLANARNVEASEIAKLSQAWGATASSLTLSGDLSSAGLSSLPTDSGGVIANHPAMRAARLKFAQRQASHELEKAHRMPDVKLGTGVRDDRDTNDTLGVLSFSIPLPITNQNQGNIKAAKERIDKASAEGHAKASELRTRFIQLKADLRSAQSRLTEMDSQTISAARQALDDTQTAYSGGKRSLLEYLDARQTLFEIEQRKIRAQADRLRAENALRILSRK